MADRRAQVIQLLATRYDGLYLPAGSLTSRAGFVPAEREPCTSCGGILIRDDYGHIIRRRKGRGWTLDAFKRRHECGQCGGAGEIARDPMDAQHLRVGSTATVATARPRARKRCDRCGGDGVWKRERCELCHGDGWRDVHLFDLHLDTRDVDERDPMLTAIEARNEGGSYHALEQALAGISHHVNKPVRYQWLTDNATLALRLLDEVYVLAIRDDVDLTVDERSLTDLALAYIVDRMPDPIRVPKEVSENARAHREHRKRVKGRAASNGAVARRDDEIRKLIKRGTPTQRVAFDYGLSVSQVNRIVARESDAA